VFCVVVKSWVTDTDLFAIYVNIQFDFQLYHNLGQNDYYTSNIQICIIVFIEPQICCIN
jgi:hypothetical protein